MRAITLHQPWATLISLGIKKHETRSWAPGRFQLKPGDSLAIHAASRKPVSIPALNELLAQHGLALKDLPLGRVVSIAKYRGAFLTQTLTPDDVDRVCGDWTPGRYAWKLAQVRNLETPCPVRGRQGLWYWHPHEYGINNTNLVHVYASPE